MPETASQRVSGALPRRRPTEKALASLTVAEATFDRRIARSRRDGGSWHRASGADGGAGVRMWAGRADWAADLRAWAESGDSAAARCGKNRRGAVELVVSIENVAAVGLYLAALASGDGRDVAAANATIARALGIAPRTVVRARTALRAGGFEAVIAAGGYMTATERAEAAAQHGGDQRRCASTTALTHPPNRVPGALPRRGSTGQALSTPRGVHKRGSAAARTKNSPRKTRQPVTLGTQRLAACLVDREAAARDAHGAPIALTALDPRWRGQHIGQVWAVLTRLAPLLMRLGIDTEPATLAAAQAAAADIVAVRTWWAQQLDGHAPPPAAANPLGEFYDATRRALVAAEGDGFMPPSAYRRRVEAQAAANLARQRAELAAAEADRARLAADPAVDEAIAAMHRQFPRSPQPKTRARWR